MDGAQELAAALPFNPNKAGEYGRAAAVPLEGATATAADPRATGSTLTEEIPSRKVGSGKPALGLNPTVLPLDRVRVDATDREAPPPRPRDGSAGGLR